jgi:hypothetical protein
MSNESSPVAPVQNFVHTPGPWRKSGWDVMGGDNSRVAIVLPWDESGCRKEDVANLLLISAAPDLLAACKRLMQEIADGQTTVYEESGIACELIEAAIKRASQVV